MRPRVLHPLQVSALRDRLIGSADSVENALVALGWDDAELDRAEELVAESGIERCEECDTWVESSELVDDDDDTIVTSCVGCGQRPIAG